MACSTYSGAEPLIDTCGKDDNLLLESLDDRREEAVDAETLALNDGESRALPQAHVNHVTAHVRDTNLVLEGVVEDAGAHGLDKR